MPYCTIVHVNAYVPQSPFTAQTVPSQAMVESFIDDVANTLDLSLVNLGYVVPIVTGTGALRELRKANAWGALGIAQQARITAVAPDQAINKSIWTKMFDDWLRALADPKNPFELGDATRNGLEIIKPVGEMQRDTTNLIGGVDTFDYLDSPPFQMDQKL